ncbi:MAG TPA: helix-turn-helix transcriptional regulator [Planctomycetota bacterium]|nr:helix-turn-helix transcriptional regulator [Planctomycetota bacterium]
MGLIKSDRQLAITQKTLGELEAAVHKLRAKYKGQALRLYASGPLGMIEQIKGEIREYRWLMKATPTQVMNRYPVVKIQDVGPFLARLRIASGITQEELAQRMGSKQPDVARLEDNDYQGYTANTLKAVALVLGVEIVVGARKAAKPKRVG